MVHKTIKTNKTNKTRSKDNGTDHIKNIENSHQENSHQENSHQENSDKEICVICANDVNWFAIGPCNHKFCHLCSLKLRALYKSYQCPICKSDQDKVIFSEKKEMNFEDYHLEEMARDDKLKIYFNDEKSRVDILKDLNFNCPEVGCGFVSHSGIYKLKSHVSSQHNKFFCNLCLENKKIFFSEQMLYNKKDLSLHIRFGSKSMKGEDDGFRGHPHCKFCDRNYFDNDSIYEHLRESHETCFICQRRDPKDRSYFKDYNELEKHFEKDHYICKENECIEKKFIVFESLLDLRAHELEDHIDKYSKIQRAKMKKQLQTNMDFNYSREHSFVPSSSRARDRERPRQEKAKNIQENKTGNNKQSSRRVNAPAGFGASLQVSEEEPPNQSQIHEVTPPSIAEEKWPTLNGDIAPVIPITRTFKSNKKDLSSKELWPELSEAPIAGSSKTSHYTKLYSKQHIDKRPPLPKNAHNQRNEMPPPLPSLPKITNPTPSITIPTATMDSISSILNRDKSKIDTFKNLSELLNSNALQPREYLYRLDKVMSDPGLSQDQVHANVLKVAQLLMDQLGKNKANRLQSAIREITSKNESFPGLPNKSKVKSEAPSTRKVLIIKTNGTGIRTPPKHIKTTQNKLIPSPQPSTSNHNTQTGSSQPKNNGENSKNKHRVKGKKLDWTQL